MILTFGKASLHSSHFLPKKLNNWIKYFSKKPINRITKLGSDKSNKS